MLPCPPCPLMPVRYMEICTSKDACHASQAARPAASPPAGGRACVCLSLCVSCVWPERHYARTHAPPTFFRQRDPGSRPQSGRASVGSGASKLTGGLLCEEGPAHRASPVASFTAPSAWYRGQHPSTATQRSAPRLNREYGQTGTHTHTHAYTHTGSRPHTRASFFVRQARRDR